MYVYLKLLDKIKQELIEVKTAAYFSRLRVAAKTNPNTHTDTTAK